MTSSCRDVHQLGLHVDGNHAECLNHIHHQERVMSASDASNPLEVGAKARRVLDLADGHNSGPAVNQPNEFLKIDATVALFTNTHFHAKRLSQAQPGIKV